MKKLLSILTILFLGISICLFTACTNGKTDKYAYVKNVEVIESDFEVTIDDIIRSFYISELFYRRSPGAIYPILNSVEPRPFHFHDGTLFTYIFNNKVESDVGLKEVAKSFIPVLEIRPGVEPLIFQVNNALIIYVADFSIKDRIASHT
jgi:hypothetical protein